MKKTLSHILAFSLLAVFIFPFFTHAQATATKADKTSLIVCLGTSDDPCGFPEIILLINNLVRQLIIYSTLLAAVIAAIAGFRLLTSGGDKKALDSAKHMAISVLKGYAVIIVGWLLIYTITTALLDPNTTFSFLGKP